MYYIYENNVLIETTESPQWQAYDERVKSFYCVAEADARALMVTPSAEGSESYYANINGKEGYSWLTRTVTIEKR